MCAQMLIFIIKSYIHCVSYPQMLILTLHCHIHFKNCAQRQRHCYRRSPFLIFFTLVVSVTFRQ